VTIGATGVAELAGPTRATLAAARSKASRVEIGWGATRAGSGTVTVGGTIDNRRVARPGEYGGTIRGGKAFKVKTGDLLNIPANQPHATVADGPDGMTYVLMKVNVGLYPWSLINGTP